MSSSSALLCRLRKKKKKEDAGLFYQRPDVVCVICLSVFCTSVVHNL